VGTLSRLLTLNFFLWLLLLNRFVDYRRLLLRSWGWAFRNLVDSLVYLFGIE
jgi:hypothetical protein